MTPDTNATRVVLRDGRVERAFLRKAAVHFLDEQGARPRFVLDQRLVRIGSHPENRIVLDHPSVSRTHAVIELDDRGYLLRDLGSTNGTWVGGMRLREGYLAAGTVVALGLVRVRFDPLVEEVPLDLSAGERFGKLVGKSLRMREVFRQLERFAQSDITVLLLGETGTGKELAARALHEVGARRAQPFVVFDSTTVPFGLVESALFGHVKGAFSGAATSQRGVVEQAAGGTLFLDEVGQLSTEVQAKLLRFLDRREYRPLGATQDRTVDVRIVAASNRDLGFDSNMGRFRADLYFRLNGAEVRLPPLRERTEDIPLLVRALLEELVPVELLMEIERGAPPDFYETMTRRSWPGNVRELRNYLERALTGTHLVLPEPSNLSTSRRIPLEADSGLPYKDAKARLMEMFDRIYLGQLLKESGGNVSEAARRSGLARVHLRELLQRQGLLRRRDSGSQDDPS